MAVMTEESTPVVGRYDAQVRRELRLLPNWWLRGAVIALVAAIVLLPLNTASDFVLSLGITIGIYAVGAIGLNLLSGYTGQVSLGHSFFVGVGAYAAVAIGGIQSLPLPVWVVGAAATGGVVGLAVGPFALRLRGIYQIVLTLGLVYIGHFIFVNWRSLTGGNNGINAELALKLGPLDFAHLSVGNVSFSYQQGLFIVVWLLVALSTLLVHNIVRTRAGRAMMAVRDAELAAEVAGISAARAKVGAFAAAGAFGGLSGALLVAQLRYVSPEQFQLTMAIQFIVIIIVGGVGTTWGPVIGSAVICSIPQITSRYGESIPLVKSDFDPDGGFGIKTGQFNLVVYGLILVLFLILEPRGLSHLLGRAWRWLLSQVE
jgi:branched-chain amino acid transport system permease protein